MELSAFNYVANAISFIKNGKKYGMICAWAMQADYDKISEQIESKKAQRELFRGFIRALEKQGVLVEEFDQGLWSSLVQEVVVNAKDDILFIFKNGFEIKTR